MSEAIDAYLNAQYDNRAAVKDFADYLDSWVERSLAYRALRSDAALDIPYANSERACLDIFPATASGAPVHVFIHGGYWKALNKDSFSFVAKTFNEAGETAVILNYALCPNVGIADIIAQIRQAMRWVFNNLTAYGGDISRCQVTGHSAGGHLLASLLTDNWQDLERDCPPVRQLNSLSGLFDLRRLVATGVNDVLALTEDNADEVSPLLQPMHCIDPGLRLNLRVGEQESDEYKQQSQWLFEKWQHQLQIDYREFPGTHHFSIVDYFLEHDYQPLQ